MEDGARPLSCFSPHGGTAFATVSTDGRLKIRDSNSGKLLTELVEKNHLARSYTCISWWTAESREQKATPTKKRKASSQPGRCTGTIALGTDSGEIVVFNLKKNELQCVLSDKSKALGESVSDLAFNKNGSFIYSCSGSSKKVEEWSLENDAVTRTFKGYKNGCSKICLSACNTYLAIGSSAIKVLDLSSGKVVKKCEGGHSALISFLGFTSDGQAVVSTCVGGRDINIFSLKKDSTLPTRSIPMAAFPACLSLLSSDKMVTIGATTTNGTCHVFQVNLAEEPSSDSDVQKCSFLLPSKAESGQSSTPKKRKRAKALRSYVDAIGINLLDSSSTIAREVLATQSGNVKNGLVVQLARGADSTPRFESLVLTNEEGSLPNELEVGIIGTITSVLLPAASEISAVGDDEDDVAVNVVGEIGKGVNAGELASRSVVAGEVHILGGSQGGKHTATEKGEFANKKRKMEAMLADGDGVGDEDEMTMEERANILQKGFAAESSDEDERSANGDFDENEGSLVTDGSDAPQFGSLGLANGNVASASSLTTLLQQALQSNDSQLLEHCLGASDPEVIDTTIARLPPATALAFLHKIVERLERRPNRARALVIWVRVVLFRHTSYLVTVPELVNSLARLYQTVDTRLVSFKKFLKLSGRLELLLEQISQQQTARTIIESVSSRPESEFVEGEEYDNCVENGGVGSSNDLDGDVTMDFDGDGEEEDIDLDAIVLK